MRILVSVGEVSGDRLGARLVPALRAELDEPRLAGSVGPCLRDQGVGALADMASFSHSGWSSIARSAPILAWDLWRYLRAIDRFAPQGALVVDSPGLHGIVLGRLRRRGVPCLWVAPPQLWAWRDRRPAILSGLRVHPLHRFEVASLSVAGADARWLGYPRDPESCGASSGDSLLLFPGSRPSWRKRHAALFLAAARASGTGLEPVYVHPAGAGPELGVACMAPREALAAGALALVLPGTAALDVALAGLPAVLAARPGRFDAWMARGRLADGPYGLPNRILGPVYPEVLGDSATVDRCARALAAAWEHREETRAILARLPAELWSDGAELRLARSAKDVFGGD